MRRFYRFGKKSNAKPHEFDARTESCRASKPYTLLNHCLEPNGANLSYGIWILASRERLNIPVDAQFALL